MTCPTCNGKRTYWNDLLKEDRPCIDCQDDGVFFHAMVKPDTCDHDFDGFRAFADGNGGEQVCTKCGMGAMAHTLATGF